jgi:hypothetical protein
MSGIYILGVQFAAVDARYSSFQSSLLVGYVRYLVGNPPSTVLKGKMKSEKHWETPLDPMVI